MCTKNGCQHGVILEPVLKEMVGHIHKHHIALVPKGGKMLEELLDQLNLDSSASTFLIPSLLPAAMIPDVEVYFDGWYCCTCSYTIKSKSSFYGHVKHHNDRDEEATALHPVPIQLIHRASSRYLYVRDAELDPTPKQALPAAATVEEGSVSASLMAKVKAFAKQDEELCASHTSAQDRITSFAGNAGPWAIKLG